MQLLTTATTLIAGLALSLGSQLSPAGSREGGKALDVRPLTTMEAESRRGADSSWRQECVGGQSCVEMAEDSNGISCPSGYMSIYTSGCPSKACVHSCASSARGSLCVTDYFSSCKDSSLVDSPGLCGAGQFGHCNYNTITYPGLKVVNCESQNNCTQGAGDGAMNCGVIRTCG